MKQLMFRIIKFVESEKEGDQLFLYSTQPVDWKLCLVFQEQLYSDCETKYAVWSRKKRESKIQLRCRTVSEASVLPKYSQRKRKISVDIPLAGSSAKKRNCGRKKT